MSTSDGTTNTHKVVELKQVGFTLGIGVAVMAASLFLFGIAVRCRSTHIAPRCEARPREVIYNPQLLAPPVQNRGDPLLLGWLFWVLGLTYDQLISGVEGTGTRRGGLKGELLKVNLDHILLLRFNALCLKISVVAMVVYCTVCLPIYFYARCSNVPLGEFNITHYPTCNSTLGPNIVFSSYSRFTLANVPDLTDQVLTADYHLASFTLYCVALSTWLVCWFACFELFHEWIDILAMRRVYYLEYDMWKGRKAELRATMLCDVEGTTRSGRSHEELVNEEKHLFERDAWIPHPEQRDTPCNIELYSVLVGGLPAKPEDCVRPEDLEGALQSSFTEEADWQMSIVSTFFDSCVPNQPGYSSSVAAVTILPSATELAIAWKTWYRAAKHLSRLRFIRRRIIELGHKPLGQKLVDDLPDQPTEYKSSELELAENSDVFDSRRRREYTAQILGAGIEDDINDEFWKSLNLGPEQIAIYNLEFSKGLAGCCPHGFCEERISYCTDLQALHDMEEDAAELVRESYAAMKEAGETAMKHKQREGLLDLKLKLDDLLVEEKDRLMRLSSMVTESKLMKKSSSQHGSYGKGRMATAGEESAKPPATLERQDSDDASFKTAASRIEPGRGSSRGFEAGLLRRASVRSRNLDPHCYSDSGFGNLWEDVERIASESKNLHKDVAMKYKVSNGQWQMPTLQRGLRGLRKKIVSLLSWTQDNSNEVTDVMARDTQYAVVTFTSRQAAIAARNCLADGRGAKSFMALNALPVPPLADSAAFNICDCRGFTRPITIGLNEHQKNWRRTFSIVLVGFIYIFYTFPITWAAKYGTEAVVKLFPVLENRKETVQGFVDGQILTLFLALLPDVFLWVANFSGIATSMVESENVALRFYWFFMVCFAIIGSSIAQMVIDAYENGSLELSSNLQTIAQTIPVDVSSTWLNWIIQKATIFHPLFYLLQASTWISAIFCLKCLVRVFRGGGAGNRLPYRIYVEAGTVILCCVAFSPQAPILSPFAVLFFLICTPLKRWALIFIYKPLFDSGGSRWPLLFDMIMTSLSVGQLLLCSILTFKHAYGPAILAIVPLLPLYMFRRQIQFRFLEAFMDAALLQTSMLDGWDVGPESEHVSYRGREEFRQFLVDAHKASYVPVCIAAINANVPSCITSEPAVVLPLPNDVPDAARAPAVGRPGLGRRQMTVRDRREAFRYGHKRQAGALNRRQLVSTDDLSSGLSDPEPIHYERSNISEGGTFPTPMATIDSDRDISNGEAGMLDAGGDCKKEPVIRVSALGSLRAKPGETGEVEYVFTSTSEEFGEKSEEHHA